MQFHKMIEELEKQPKPWIITETQHEVAMEQFDLQAAESGMDRDHSDFELEQAREDFIFKTFGEDHDVDF